VDGGIRGDGRIPYQKVNFEGIVEPTELKHVETVLLLLKERNEGHVALDAMLRNLYEFRLKQQNKKDDELYS